MKIATTILEKITRGNGGKEDVFDLRLKSMMKSAPRRARVAFPGLFHFRRAEA